MGPGATYALVTFCTGVLLLVGWLYATTDNPRSSAMVKSSLVLFVVPTMLVPIGLLPLGLAVWVAIEEGLKAFASTREQRRIDKFWLVGLFGIWELALSKPFWGLVIAQPGESWDRLAMIGLAYSTALPVLMHAVTAAIYAFTFGRRLWAAFLVCWFIHMAFNFAVTYYPSPIAVVVETVVLAAILIGLLQRQRSQAKERR